MRTRITRMDREENSDYQSWLFALRATAELLLQSNNEDQSVYANVGAPDEWKGNAFTLWCGSSPRDWEPTLRIGDMEALWVWDGRIDFHSPEAQRVWAELWPEAAREPLQATVGLLAAHAGLKLSEEWSGAPKARFACWARIFTAVVDCLPLLSSLQQWALLTSFHGGWGTYYLHFVPLTAGTEFALSEEGHLALLPTGLDEDLRSFNIRSFIEDGLPREAVVAQLLPRLQRCVKAAGRLQGSE